MAKRYYDQALETSLDAYLPVTLALMSLHFRSLYHSLFIPATPDSPKPLSLFSSPSSPAISSSKSSSDSQTSSGKLSNAWSSVGRVWRDIQRRWGFGEVEGVGGQGGERNTAADRAETQRALEGDDDLATDWRRNREDDAEEDDEFYDFEGEEGDLTSTLAIISLCLLLAYAVSVPAVITPLTTDSSQMVAQFPSATCTAGAAARSRSAPTSRRSARTS